ncbi:MAG: hypothetical protein SCH71_17070 [Desulfobulbaceae bacterium]|nr:hypothetical protein [Desulfobulbaceae bacterium]
MVLEQPVVSGKKTGLTVLRTIFFLALILIALFILKIGVAKQLAVSNSIYLDVLSGFQTNPDVLAGLAQREHKNGDLAKAHEFYLQALDNFVMHPPSWLGLAAVLKDMGRRNQAVAALENFAAFQIDDIDLAWQKARLAYELQHNAILLATLKQLLQDERISRPRVFNLAGEYWNDPRYLLQVFGSTFYPDILRHYIENNRQDKAQTVWRELKEAGVADPRTTVAYVSFLLENNEFESAVEEWREAFQKNDNLLYNGNFSEPIQNTAFGWQATETRGASLHYETFRGGLTVSFDGTENAVFMLSQIVPLFPGDHVFRGFFETTGLTSQERPYFLISSYNCQGLFIEDEMLPPSEYKTEFVIPFTVPDTCSAVRIYLVRERANPYDMLISGSVTLSDLEINRLSPLPPRPEPPRQAVSNPESAPAPNSPPARQAEDLNPEELPPEIMIFQTTTIIINALVIRD